MPQQLLVITPDTVFGETLGKRLREQGYPVTVATGLTKPSSLEHPPAICLIDLELHRNPTGGHWESWLQDCITAHVACLAFDCKNPPDRSLIERLEPLGDILTHPEDMAALENRVRSLLTTRKLHRQLEAARHQLAKHHNELQESLRSAALIQRSLIPARRSNIHNLLFSWKFMPSKQVGGDLFNIVQLDEQTVMVYLVDVSGHGISSAMVTVSVHQTLSLHTSQIIKHYTDHPPYYEIATPGAVMRELEAEYPFERFQEFFTISYLLINPHTGEIRYCNAGHPPPLLLRRDGSTDRLTAGGTVIGMGSLVSFEEGEARMEAGDRLYLYTDGITEHVDANGTLYGEERFLSRLRAQTDTPLDIAVQNALIALREFGGSTLPVDDVTLIGIEYSSPADETGI